MATLAGPHAAGARIFGRLGRWVVRHPWYPIVVWVALLVITLPFLSRLGSVTTNSFTTVPNNAPSSQAAAKLAELFPNSTGGSSTYLLFTGGNLTDGYAQRVIENVTAALDRDRALSAVSSIGSVYTDYAAYLAGQVRLAAGVVASGLTSSPPLPAAVNASAELLWGPPAAFLSAFEAAVANGTAPAHASYPAFVATNASLHNASASLVLSSFFLGYAENGSGFNGTPRCWAAAPAAVAPCAIAAARTNLPPVISALVPDPAQQAVPRAVLATLDLENSTDAAAQRATAAGVLAGESGLPAGWIGTVWAAFPSGVVTPGEASAWANGTVANATLAAEPLPVPLGILRSYVDASGTAQLIDVSFSVADDATNASGGDPVYHDLDLIDGLVPGVLRSSDPVGSIDYVQTGPAPLDLLTQTAVNSSLALVLPLTVGLLLVISMVYFRSPITPLATFAGLGIALVLGLGGTVLIGTFIQHVDSTALTLEEVFVLGVGTDYSIFLVARYREELVRGASSDEAIVTSVAWAGQSVATSGSTAIIATLSLAFSGVALLAQWGEVLALAILITVLLSLTVIPAFLKLFGPRLFWPTTGDRFARRAAVVAERQRTERTYFYRVGRATQRRPWAILAALLAISVPLIAVALTVPLSYDFYDQLPSGHNATVGLSELGNHFGPGFATPSFVLVTFASPLVVANQTNATEFTDLAQLTALAENSSGIASVESPIGPYGAPLGSWIGLAGLPSAERQNLLGLWSGFVGTDGRTVLLDLVPSSTGLSVAAVQAVGNVQHAFAGYTADHAAVTATAYGGGAPTINDLANSTAQATDYLILAVTIGLLVVLLVVLRSWIIALMAIATIGLSISWAWALTYLVFQELLGYSLFFFVRTILFILILGLGIDYNIFLLTRVREERVRGRSSSEATVEGVAKTGGIITAAAIILASAFAALTVGDFVLIAAIGFSVAIAVVLDAMVVRTFLVPAALQVLGDRVWSLTGRRPPPAPAGPPPAPGASPAGAPSGADREGPAVRTGPSAD
ncbi:MAG TPA: MMPL family transporter [Thermoplasmata archaeon]|nr:MMPL family transporter [Thermoplasmata archaeon]